MFDSPYSTTACKAYQTSHIVEQVEKYLTLNGLTSQINEIDTHINCYALSAGAAAIEPFGHPLSIHVQADREHPRFIVDVRNFTRFTRNGELDVSSSQDYALACMRCKLQHCWQLKFMDSLTNTGNFQITVFTRWLSGILTTRLNLDVSTQITVSVITAYYYLCLFMPDGEKRDVLKMSTAIARGTYMPVDKVIDIVETLPFLENIVDYCNTLKQHSNNIRFEEFNAPLLYTFIGNSWYGNNSRELLAVALEHPPTFIAVLYAAINERGYKNTQLGKVVQSADRNSAAKTFSLNLLTLLKTCN